MSQTEQFEAAFSEFLESKGYDETEEALFALVRKAYMAGWQAAKQEDSKDEKLVWFPGVHK